MQVAFDQLEDIVNRSDKLVKELGLQFNAPSGVKQVEKLFKIGEVSKMVGRSTQSIRDSEESGDLEKPEVDKKNNRRKGYTLKQVNNIREYYGTNPVLMRTDAPRIISFSNFKGGVGKSTTAVHAAQSFATSGFRVLFIDMDPQASSSSLLGYEPDLQLTEADTVAPYIYGDKETLDYAVRDTYWENLDLIPSCLDLYGIEYAIAGMAAEESAKHATANAKGEDYESENVFSYLSNGIETVIHNYDIVVIDPPPALGMISINVLYAATAIVIPMPLSMLDFLSTIQFYKLTKEVVETLGKQGINIGYHFIKILLTRKKARTESDEESTDIEDQIYRLAKEHYGAYLMDSIIYESKAIKDATGELKTLFELEKPIGSTVAYKNALASMNATCLEIETELRKTWPSFCKKIKSDAA